MRVSFNWETKGSRQSEIRKFYVVTICVDEEILGLKIPVKDPMLMQMDECLQDLVKKSLGLLPRERSIPLRSHILLQIKL